MGEELVLGDIELKLGNGKVKSWKSESKLLEWLEKEEEFWSWAKDKKGSSGSVAPQISQLKAAITVVGNRLNQPTSQTKTNLDRALSTLENNISSRNYLTSDDELSLFAKELFESNEKLAITLLSVAARSPHASALKTAEEAKALAYLANFELGIEQKSVLRTKRSLDKTVKSANQKLHDFAYEQEKLFSEIEKLLSENGTQTEAAREALSEFLEKYERVAQVRIKQALDNADESLKEKLSQQKQEIEDFKKALQDKLALEQPVTYWEQKGKRHKWGTFFTFVAFVLWCCLIAYGLKEFVASFENGGGISDFFDYWKEAKVTAFGAFASVLGLSLIAARVFYRLFASQLHLWNDSAERVTMVLTYLALAEKGHAKEEFLGGLLARLFAPASDGVVRDDLGSAGPVDWVSKNISK